MVSKKERLWSRAWRAAKALFFVANMLASLLLDCAPPLLVVVIDLLLPCALFAAAGGKGPALASEIRNYRFRGSLVDLPLVSAARSIFILCLYLCFSGRGPYLGLATLCASMSAGYVSLKAIAMFGAASSPGKRRLLSLVAKEGPAVEVLLLSSLALAVGHVVAAYRTSCRERRRLLVYKIDIEAVSAYNNGFANYKKLAVSK
ncbi:hypothetical protein HPP92_001756 [Vanilla planifolia]|uniref:Uncharacterized protein n=1 Tax=Vanilla planifolia TaxID=51239 RepID=A0A835VHC4_VANPL|nr:hypothetical protein HPP92_001756 [Vanilla planifolia]